MTHSGSAAGTFEDEFRFTRSPAGNGVARYSRLRDDFRSKSYKERLDFLSFWQQKLDGPCSPSPSRIPS
jgi:hypothetical protein